MVSPVSLWNELASFRLINGAKRSGQARVKVGIEGLESKRVAFFLSFLYLTFLYFSFLFFSLFSNSRVRVRGLTVP